MENLFDFLDRIEILAYEECELYDNLLMSADTMIDELMLSAREQGFYIINLEA